MTSRLPALFAVVGVVVAVALFLVLKDDTADEDTTVPAPPQQSATGEGDKPKRPPKPEIPVIEIKNGQPVGGVAEIEVSAGERIRFVVESDVADAVHLHGYDISKDVAAGGEVEFDVSATLEGGFEVELEHSVVPIAEISVVPG